MAKKVLLVVVDALATRVVVPAIESGRLPHFARLAALGQLEPSCYSIFPSITPAATGSIVSGCYPAEHGVMGAWWYDQPTGRVAYFGDDFWVVMREGIGRYFNDFLIRLNEQLLHCETLFEAVERKGMTAATLNYMWYRGAVPHAVHPPLLLRMLPGAEFAPSIKGPEICYVGDFVSTPVGQRGKTLGVRGGLWKRYGFHDDVTGEELVELVRRGLPDFTLAYFPNNDFLSHDRGAQQAVEALEGVDRWLGKVFDVFGGVEPMLAHVAVLVTGDHSQSDLRENSAIDLDALLAEFELVKAGARWENQRQIMACPNMRAALVYLRRESMAEREKVVSALLRGPQIDQVIWSLPHGEHGRSFHVATADRGQLEFWLARGQRGSADDVLDEFGNRWTIRGELACIDAHAQGERVVYGDYPNALERIAMALGEGFDEVWVTARLGFEFTVPETKSNRRGSHGSLHRLDSQAPLISAGLPQEVQPPSPARIVDVMPLCLAALGITPSTQ